ncbi:ImuA family protein [Sedimentitalea sp. XS_ASV28]|uniref:ImuA family protein n=1 Tax=Sedimentitalea sp. XS_ASV28 TaxID=3241296 RepID=UPI003514347E
MALHIGQRAVMKARTFSDLMILMQRSIGTAYPLRTGRLHEVSGPGAITYVLWTARQMGVDVLWVREQWQPEMLYPQGFEGFDPARLVMALAKDQTDVLAVAEEALRDGAFGMVALQISAPLSLTVGRRLQLAAQAGGKTGLCLIPEGMGSNATETRWHSAPIFDPDDSTLQCWQLIKNKSGTLGYWHVRWNTEAGRVAVVPPALQRPGSEDAPD